MSSRPTVAPISPSTLLSPIRRISIMSCPRATNQGSAPANEATRFSHVSRSRPDRATTASISAASIHDPGLFVKEPRNAQCRHHLSIVPQRSRQSDTAEDKRPIQQRLPNSHPGIVFEPPDLRRVLRARRGPPRGPANDRAHTPCRAHPWPRGSPRGQILAPERVVVAVDHSEYAPDASRVQTSHSVDYLVLAFALDQLAVRVAPPLPEPQVVLALDDQESPRVHPSVHLDLGRQDARRLVLEWHVELVYPPALSRRPACGAGAPRGWKDSVRQGRQVLPSGRPVHQ